MIEKSTCVTFATTTLLMPKVGNYKIWSKINYGKFYRLILNFMSSLDALSHSFKNTACPYLACFWLPVLFICLFIKLGWAECVRTNVVCALADIRQGVCAMGKRGLPLANAIFNPLPRKMAKLWLRVEILSTFMVSSVPPSVQQIDPKCYTFLKR